MSGFCSLQEISLPIGGLSLVCSANGCGKCIPYRRLELIAAVAERTQNLVVAHAKPLIPALAETTACSALRLERELDPPCCRARPCWSGRPGAGPEPRGPWGWVNANSASVATRQPWLQTFKALLAAVWGCLH